MSEIVYWSAKIEASFNRPNTISVYEPERLCASSLRTIKNVAFLEAGNFCMLYRQHSHFFPASLHDIQKVAHATGRSEGRKQMDLDLSRLGY